MYALVTGNERLKPGETATKEFNLKAVSQVSGREIVARIRLYDELDIEQFFTYRKYSAAYAEIRQP